MVSFLTNSRGKSCPIALAMLIVCVSGQQKCKKPVSFWSGTFGAFLQYPVRNNYTSNEYCSWTITSSSAYPVIEVNIHWTDIQECTNCQCDSLTIRAGSRREQIKKLCGTVGRQQTFRSPFSSLELHFQSDGGIEKRGFLLTINFRNDMSDCLTMNCSNPSGGFVQYPQSGLYLNDDSCSWIITADSASAVLDVTVHWTRIQPSINCTRDHLKIFSPDGTERKSLCGMSSQRQTYQSSDRWLRVQISSERSYPDTGFMLSYVSSEVGSSIASKLTDLSGLWRSNCSYGSCINPCQPYHCLEHDRCNSSAEMEFLSASEDTFTSGNFSFAWNGWGSISPISLFALLLYPMVPSNGALIEGTMTVWSHSPGRIVLPYPGIYSAILKVTNSAGYVSCARKLIVFDNDSVWYQIHSDQFMVLSAKSDGQRKWIIVSGSEGSFLDVGWQDAFAAVKPAWMQFDDKFVAFPFTRFVCFPKMLDDPSDIETWRDRRSNLTFEFADLIVDDDDDATFEGDFSRGAIKAAQLTNYSLQRRINISDGQMYMAALRAVDALGRQRVLTTRAFAASSGPVIADFKAISVNLTFETNETTRFVALLHFSVQDQWTGVQEGEWSLIVQNKDGMNISLNESSMELLRIPLRNCPHIPDCYCTKTKSGRQRDIGCFLSRIQLPVNGVFNLSRHEVEWIFLELRVMNYANISTRDSKLLWPLHTNLDVALHSTFAVTFHKTSEMLLNTALQPNIASNDHYVDLLAPLLCVSILLFLALIVGAVVFFRRQQSCSKRIRPLLGDENAQSAVETNELAEYSLPVDDQYARVTPKEKRKLYNCTLPPARGQPDSNDDQYDNVTPNHERGKQKNPAPLSNRVGCNESANLYDEIKSPYDVPSFDL